MKYKQYNANDKLSDVLYSILKSDVFMIKYQDGRKDVFDEARKEPEPTPLNGSSVVNNTPEKYTAEEMQAKGRADAKEYYHKYRGGMVGTEFASMVSPLLGLIPAITIASHPPKEDHLGYPNPELYKSNKDYREAYNKKARQIKAHKIWTGYIVGAAVDIAIVGVIIAFSS